MQDGRAWWVHSGDSRLYLIRNGELVVRTRDHSYVESLLQQGLISAAEAVKHPQRNLVLSCLGTLGIPRVDLAILDLKVGDVMLLCSDGAWGPLREQMLVSAFSSGDVDKVAPHILDLAEKNAGHNGDNLTLIAMHWEGDDAGPITIANFPDTVFDASCGSIPELLSDADIERAIVAIQTRIKRK